jgi:hypothetical protein
MYTFFVFNICNTQYYNMTPESRNIETVIARQRLGKHIPAATNTQVTIE